ncbi:class I SAM-dependent methyltransferase [Rhabdaerophilum sp. SD176]|uniref:class I SAM-dependent methyltransferase n=1 Tax=Rhabdaerophilum sp. SD176 TaxID=2983548 RepID=UPI0024E00B6D|nr:class I SAM-dependent methyltransferase [Rhabdaerophilum sp. SD176]
MANDKTRFGNDVIEGRGYILDEPYISRFYDLQTPARMSYSIQAAGFGHEMANRPFRYCELGCGNGITIVILAALHPDSWFVGIDINPDHIETANTLAREAGLTNIEFIRADFDEAQRQKPEPFDYITVHGVYSWVDAAVRASMFNFIARFLKSTGIAYISYNSNPGWAAKEPIWRLLNRYSRGVSGNSVEKMKESLKFVEFLSSSDAPYFHENPAAREHLQYLKSEDIHYIAHEFCNDNFSPVYCSDAFADARQYGLHFVAQSESAYNLPFERVAEAYREYIDSMSDRLEQETWSSLLRNDFFRTDLYTKILPPQHALEDSPLWDRVFMLIHPADDLPDQLTCGSRELAKNDALVAALITVSGTTPMTVRDMLKHNSLRRYSPRMIMETAQLLELSGYFGFLLSPPLNINGCAAKASIATTRDDAARIWHFAKPSFRPLLAMNLMSNEFGYLAAPAFGSAMRFELMDTLALLALDGRSLGAAAEEFARALNDDAPHLLRYPAKADWARGYLDAFNERWHVILQQLGSIRVGCR